MIVWASLLVAFWIGYAWAEMDDGELLLIPSMATLATLVYLVITGLLH